MRKIKYGITNEKALGGRNIERFVRKCSSFKSEICIVTEKGKANANSMLSLLYLSSIEFEESEIEIEIEGEDEELAYSALNDYLKVNAPSK